MNLYLALLNYGKNANFTTVWEQGYTEAERTGDAEGNFISWIAQIEEKNSNTTNSSSDDDEISSDTPTKILTYSDLLKFNYFIFLLFVFVII